MISIMYTGDMGKRQPVINRRNTVHPICRMRLLADRDEHHLLGLITLPRSATVIPSYRPIAAKATFHTPFAITGAGPQILHSLVAVTIEVPSNTLHTERASLFCT